MMKNIEFNGLTCFKVSLNVNRSPLSDEMNLLILESDPNPDYYAKKDFPPNKKHVGDRHLYLLVNNQINCFQDVILRNRNRIKRIHNLNMNIYPGYMSFQNKNVPCIRINTSNIDQLPLLIKEFKNVGLKFIKDQKVKAYDSFIHFKKYINFEKIDENIYQDHENQNRFFFQIDKLIEMEDFVKGIESIKFNCDFHLFDSFLAEIFIDKDVYDFIGVYSKHCDKERFAELKQQIKKQFDN